MIKLTELKKLNFIFFFSGLSKTQNVLLTHGDSVEKIGDKMKKAAVSSNDIVAAIYNEQMKIYGVQFHPEVSFSYQYSINKTSKF